MFPSFSAFRRTRRRKSRPRDDVASGNARSPRSFLIFFRYYFVVPSSFLLSLPFSVFFFFLFHFLSLLGRRRKIRVSAIPMERSINYSCNFINEYLSLTKIFALGTKRISMFVNLLKTICFDRSFIL